MEGAWTSVSIPILSIITYIPLARGARDRLPDPEGEDGDDQGLRDAGRGRSTSSSRCRSGGPSTAAKDGYQFVEKASWIPSLGVDYHFGIDGISLVLILLTTLMGVIAVVCSYTAITERQKEYYVLLLLLQTFMIGTFCCLDLFLFYVFWEVMLVPMYFLIGVWGGAAPALRGDQVLPLHAGRLGADAARHHRALLLQHDRASWVTRASATRRRSRSRR